MIKFCFEIIISLRFTKAGRVWCGGARETHWAHVTIEWLLAKPRSFSNLPAFLGLDDTYFCPENLGLIINFYRFSVQPNELRSGNFFILFCLKIKLALRGEKLNENEVKLYSLNFCVNLAERLIRQNLEGADLIG